jgi:hypothetical protein
VSELKTLWLVACGSYHITFHAGTLLQSIFDGVRIPYEHKLEETCDEY